MNKVFNAFKIVLPVLIAMIIALAVTFLTGAKNAGDGTLQGGLNVIVAVLVGIFPLIIFAFLCTALLVIEICMCVLKNKKGSIIASLVFLCLLAPVLIFYIVISLALLHKVILGVIIAIITLLVFITALVLSCILTKNATTKPYQDINE